MSEKREFQSHYRGYDLHWSGWYQIPAGITMNAIWSAKKVGSKPFCYCVVPFGASGVAYDERTVLDVSLRGHWSVVPVTVFSDAEDPKLKEDWQAMGYDELLRVLDHYIDQLKEQPENPKTEVAYDWTIDQMKRYYEQQQQALQAQPQWYYAGTTSAGSYTKGATFTTTSSPQPAGSYTIATHTPTGSPGTDWTSVLFGGCSEKGKHG